MPPYFDVTSCQKMGSTSTIINLLEGFPVHPINCDNGKEFTAHGEISEVLEAETYFAHPNTF
jgi:IS30 family transposase